MKKHEFTDSMDGKFCPNPKDVYLPGNNKRTSSWSNFTSLSLLWDQCFQFKLFGPSQADSSGSHVLINNLQLFIMCLIKWIKLRLALAPALTALSLSNQHANKKSGVCVCDQAQRLQVKHQHTWQRLSESVLTQRWVMILWFRTLCYLLS